MKALLAAIGMFVLAASAAAVAAEPARVPVRAATHEGGRVRFVFDWPTTVKATLSQGDGAARLAFAAPAAFDASRLSPELAALVRLDGAAAVFALQPGGTARQFRNGRSVVVDLVKPAAIAAAPAPAEPPKSAPEEPPAAAAPKPAGPKPTEQAAAPKPAEPKAAAAAAKPVGAPTPLRPAERAQAAAAQGTAAQGTAAQAAVPGAPVLPVADAALQPIFGPILPTTVQREAAAVTLRFAWPAGVRVAAFARDGRSWIVFDRPATVPLDRIAQGAGELVPGARQLAAAGATVLRLETVPGFSPRVERDAGGWIVRLLPGRQRPERSVMPQVEPGVRPGGPTVGIAMDSPGMPIAVRDPEIGDRLLIVPSGVGDLGLDEPFRVPEFRLLASAAGVVLVPQVEALPVTVMPDRVRIGGDAGLLLTGGPLDAPREEPLRAGAPPSISIFDFAGWTREDATFSDARRALAAAAAAAPPDRRSGARLDLARFLFARGFAPEAAGVIDLVIADDPERADQTGVRALRGAALLLADENDEAKDDLFRPSLDGIAEMGLWRGAWHAAREEWRPALAQFARGWALLDSYPKPLQERFGLLAAEAALATGNGRLAGERLGQLERLRPVEPTASRLAFLQGRLLAAQGATGEAIALWRRVETGPDRMARARAALARIEIELRDGRMDRAAAIEELERLRFVWRGDAVELAVLELLGRCYIDNKDYWNGLATLRYALSFFGDSPQAAPVAERMAEAFRRLFVAGEARNMPPLKAMALFEEYRELAPLGPEGDTVLRELSGRLLALDLLGSAAELIDHQMRFRLEKAARADAGASLALIRLLDRKPQEALDALDASEGDASAELGTRRRQLRARALMETGRSKEALAALGDNHSAESEALRADVAWNSGDWANAARTFARMAPTAAPIDAAGARIVLRWAVALSLAGKQAELKPLMARYGAAMKGSPSDPAFRMIAGDQPPDPASLAKVARSLAEADDFGAALRRWRKAVERGEGITGNGA